MAIEARIHWTEELQFVGRAGNGAAVVMDTSDGRSGPTPMELVLMGVAGCTAMDVVSILQKKRLRLRGVDVRINGEQAAEYPKRYTHIRIEYVVRGQGVTAKAVEQAIELSETKYCSAMASLDAPFTSSYRIVADGS